MVVSKRNQEKHGEEIKGFSVERGQRVSSAEEKNEWCRGWKLWSVYRSQIGYTPWFGGGGNLEYILPPDVKNWLIGKDPDAGKDWRQEEKGMTEDEMLGWHHWLDGREFEQALGVDVG